MEEKLKKSQKHIKLLLVIILVLLFIIIVGFSYAYFAADIRNSETTSTIFGDAGEMVINYDGGPNIVVGQLSPSDDPFATKNFTVTGNSSITSTMYYNISIIKESNTFTDYGLAYNLTSENTNSNGTIIPSSNDLYDSSGNTAYNKTNYSDAKNVGYMYGGANGEASTSRAGATTNETSTNIKTYLDSWYEVNIKGKSYEKYIADTLFCNDREIDTGYETGLGYAKNKTGYMARYRLYTNKTPSIKCNDQNDRFTTTNYNTAIVPGNKKLNYPIGLLTADEGALAGLKFFANNSTNYLYTNQLFWTMSPYDFYSSSARMWYVDSVGDLYYGKDVDVVMGVRGVLNLASNTPITGTGTTLDPYIAG